MEPLNLSQSQNLNDSNSELLRSNITVGEISDQIFDKEMKDLLEKMRNWSLKRQELEKNLRNIMNPNEEKIKIMMLGDTGSGKSTLTNGLVGIDLQYSMLEEEAVQGISCINPEESRTKIGHTGESETKSPVEIQHPNHPIIFFDCGGFNDTQGAGDEVQNTFYIQSLAKTLKRAKVVLTLCEAKIKERNNDIQALFGQIIKTFCNLEFLKSSLYLVVTKGRLYDRSNIQYLETRLRNLTENPQNQKIKEVVEALITNKRIGFFLEPSGKGQVKVEKTIFEDIISGINEVPQSEIGEVQIEISASAKVSITRAFLKLNECVAEQLKKISDQAISYLCKTRIDTAKSLTEVRVFCGTLLRTIPEAFSTKDSSENYILNEVTKYTDRILEFSNQDIMMKVPNQDQMKEFRENCQKLKDYVNYQKELLEICPENIVDCDKWNKEIEDLRRRIEDLFKISEKVNGNTLILEGILMSTNQIRQKAQASRKNLHNLRRVEVHCLNSFFLEGGELKLLGVDLLIASPNWVIYTPTEINLSGKNQKRKPRESEKKDGEPGLPGGKSGNFVGLCTNFFRAHLLKVILKGGKGGKGLKGKAGGRGPAGADGDLKKVKNRDREARISKEICYRLKSVAYSMLTLNSRFNEVYESKGEPGGKGEDGGKGGSGGLGGKGGYAILYIGRELYEWKVGRLQTRDGRKGRDALGGRGGEGGCGGKSYNATYFNEKVLPELTDKDYWRSRRTAQRILNGPRTASRGVIHAGMMATHFVVPVALPVTAIFQLGLSWHLANANSCWKQNPEDCPSLESEGERGETLKEKNKIGQVEPRPNDFNIDYEKIVLIENYMKHYNATQQKERFKSLIEKMHRL